MRGSKGSVDIRDGETERSGGGGGVSNEGKESQRVRDTLREGEKKREMIEGGRKREKDSGKRGGRD